MLHSSQSSTDLHQTCHHGSVLGDVITCCFWQKSWILAYVKPEVELIFTIAPSVLWHCWLGGRKGIWPVKNGGMVEVGTA